MIDDLLLIRYISIDCSPEEALLVEQWIAAGKANADRFFELERIWALKEEVRFSNKKEIQSEYLRLMNRLEKQGSIEKKKKSLRPFPLLSLSKWSGYAAAVVLLGLRLVASFHRGIIKKK